LFRHKVADEEDEGKDEEEEGDEEAHCWVVSLFLQRSVFPRVVNAEVRPQRAGLARLAGDGVVA
jgi:hypothetical protein